MSAKTPASPTRLYRVLRAIEALHVMGPWPDGFDADMDYLRGVAEGVRYALGITTTAVARVENMRGRIQAAHAAVRINCTCGACRTEPLV